MGWYYLGDGESVVIPTTQKSKWQGKKWSVLGDSNSDNPSRYEYYRTISDNIGCETQKIARGGAGWVHKGSSGSAPNIFEQIDSIDLDAELITIMAGGNDYSFGLPLGTFGDTTMDTFYGALDKSINKVIENHPLKTLAVLVQMRRSVETANGEGATVEEYANATIEVCNKYSVPTLDLYHRGNMYPWIKDFRDEMMYDGIHLTAEGQLLLARKVGSFIETL